MNNQLIQIDTGYACAGIIVKNGIVQHAAPIFKWMVGKEWWKVKQWRRIKSMALVEGILPELNPFIKELAELLANDYLENDK